MKEIIKLKQSLMEDQGSGKFYRDNRISPAPSGDK